eukprot:6490082-Pyramimonas_sp.AAC.1
MPLGRACKDEVKGVHGSDQREAITNNSDDQDSQKPGSVCFKRGLGGYAQVLGPNGYTVDCDVTLAKALKAQGVGSHQAAE